MSYKYALMSRNEVKQVIMSPVVLHFDAQDTWVDVSSIHPSPNIGWTYDSISDTYAEPTSMPVDITVLKQEAKKTIDMAAVRARRNHVPDEYGQGELYREKYEQAIDFLSSQDVVHYPDYPLLHVESKILDIPMKDIAENIIKRRSEWISKMTEIEELRLYGKAHIAFCTTESEVQLLVSHLSHKLAEIEGSGQG